MKALFIIRFSAVFLAINPGLMAQGEEGPDCSDCHSDLLERTILHYPAEDACDNCHNDPGPEHPGAGFPGGSLADSLPGLCFLCHDAGTHEHRVKHQVGNNCLSCHDPHGSDYSFLLKRKKRELCMDCHSGMKKLDRMEEKHFPFEDDCGSCHLSHSSTFPGLLVEDYPAKLYAPGVADTFALCFLCHDRALIEEETTEWGTGFRDGRRNLHHLHLKGEKGRTCMLCHSAHASSQSHLLARKIPFGEWEMPLEYTTLENGGACNTGCHSRKTYLRD